MAQQIKVQDGIVVYSTSDPSTSDLDFSIKGQITLGNTPLSNGLITTPTGSDLLLQPSGDLVLVDAVWPSSIPTLGQFLIVSGTNQLSFQVISLGTVGSDTLTESQLNLQFPTALPGQFVSGPTVVYLCISIGTWRTAAGALGYTPVNKAGDTMTGALILNADPTTALGAVTKQYADAISAGLNIHAAVRTSTVEDLATSSGGSIVYNNGSGGVGATLTTTGSFTTIGAVSLVANDRVLVKDEVNQTYNGIYIYSSSTLLTRATDFDGSPTSEITAGDFTYVQEGTLTGTSWVQITTGTIIVGTSNIVFSQFSGPQPTQGLIINTQPSDYMLQLSDAYNTLVRITKATPALVTIPNDSTIDFPIGSAVLISWNGLGQVTIDYEVGVTVDTPDTYLIGKQFGKITAIKTGPNHWEIEGNLEPI